MAALYEKDWKYSWARVWCDSATRSLFSVIRSEGKENVPRDGSVLLAPNHCNTLMDALVILQDWKEATLFGARADIFRKPAVRKILRFLRILPIPRARDGAREVTHNRATMEEVAECLEHGMRFCMFCEGTHRPKHTLLPLKKGIARTALVANARPGGRKPVYIVPVGLEYQDYYRLRTPLAIRYGEPINVTQFVQEHPGLGEGKVYRMLLTLLRERIAALITCLPDDGTYEARWALTRIAGPEAALTADGDLLREAEAFDRRRKAAGLSSWSFLKDMPKVRVLARATAGILLLPLLLAAAVLSAPLWIPSAFLVRRLKDKAFSRTVHFGVRFALTPLVLLGWGLVFFLCLPAGAAAAAFLFAAASHTLLYEVLERGRILLSDIRLAFGHADLRETFSRIRTNALKTTFKQTIIT